MKTYGSLDYVSLYLSSHIIIGEQAKRSRHYQRCANSEMYAYIGVYGMDVRDV